MSLSRWSRPHITRQTRDPRLECQDPLSHQRMYTWCKREIDRQASHTLQTYHRVPQLPNLHKSKPCRLEAVMPTHGPATVPAAWHAQCRDVICMHHSFSLAGLPLLHDSFPVRCSSACMSPALLKILAIKACVRLESSDCHGSIPVLPSYWVLYSLTNICILRRQA